MTVAAAPNRVVFVGDDATTAFAIPFEFFDNPEVVVILRDENVSPLTETLQVDGPDYTLTGGTPPTTVTMSTPPATGEKLLIIRLLPLSQIFDFITGGAVPPESLEEGLDRYLMIAQQNDEALDRCLKFKQSSPSKDFDLPEPLGDAVLGWATDALSIENKVLAAGAILVIRAGAESLPDAAVTVTAVFSSALSGTGFAVIPVLRNTVDGVVDFQPITVTDKTIGGFTAKWNAPLSSANYFLDYIALENT